MEGLSQSIESLIIHRATRRKDALMRDRQQISRYPELETPIWITCAEAIKNKLKMRRQDTLTPSRASVDKQRIGAFVVNVLKYDRQTSAVSANCLRFVIDR